MVSLWITTLRQCLGSKHDYRQIRVWHRCRPYMIYSLTRLGQKCERSARKLFQTWRLSAWYVYHQLLSVYSHWTTIAFWPVLGTVEDLSSPLTTQVAHNNIKGSTSWKKRARTCWWSQGLASSLRRLDMSRHAASPATQCSRRDTTTDARCWLSIARHQNTSLSSMRSEMATLTWLGSLVCLPSKSFGYIWLRLFTRRCHPGI